MIPERPPIIGPHDFLTKTPEVHKPLIGQFLDLRDIFHLQNTSRTNVQTAFDRVLDLRMEGDRAHDLSAILGRFSTLDTLLLRRYDWLPESTIQALAAIVHRSTVLKAFNPCSILPPVFEALERCTVLQRLALHSFDLDAEAVRLLTTHVH
jgi:hypothetical protein